MEPKNNNQPPLPQPIKANELIGASGKIYRESIKFNEWLRLILDRKNKETFGNFTQAALTVYGLDEDDPKQYATACAMGSHNFRKVKDIASLTLQKQGLTFGVLMETLRVRALTSPSSNWWEIATEMLGYRERKVGVQLNQNNQYNVYHGAGNEEIESHFETMGVDGIHSDTFADLLVEGNVQTGNEQEPLMEIHTEELRTEDSPEQSVQKS